MIENITYILTPSTISNTSFYLPIMIIFGLSPFFIWLISMLIVKNPKIKLVLDMFNFIYAILLLNVFLQSLLYYFLTQIYQIITYFGDVNISLQLANYIYELTTIYSIISLFAPIYYIFGLLALFVDLIYIIIPWTT
jgi:hypothetical protein